MISPRFPWRTRFVRMLVPLLLGLSCHPSGGATLSYSSSAPVPDGDDVSNLAGALTDRDNVGGNGTSDGAGNDGSTYVAADRPSQGQTFRTGSAADGYLVRAVWLKHAGYSGNSSTTWWRMASSASLTLRITDPTAAGGGGFERGSETLVLTGAEDGAPNDFAPAPAVTNSSDGTGVWIRIALESPVHVPPDTQCGFDVTSTSSTLFFETLGVRDAAAGGDRYPAGAAYRGSTNGSTDNTLVELAGDRVFMVELEEGSAPPEPGAPYARPLVAASVFPLDRIDLLDGRFRENQELHRTGYLAWLDTDRLLYQYRAVAGLPQPPGATNLGGWEGDEGTGWGANACRGHMLGHYLSGASKMVAATGDAALLAKIRSIVTELRTCQDAIGVNEIAAGRVYGYLGGLPSSKFTTLENNPAGATVPFYTIHKTFAGLVDVYRNCGIDLALDIAIGMSDYHRWRVDRLSAPQIEAMFRTDNGNSEEWGGMNEALTDIYLLSRARGDADPGRHLEFARIFHRDWFVNPLSSGLDQLNGLHANTHVPQVVGFARAASVIHESEADRQRLYAAAENFWHMVTGEHSFCMGGNSFAEHFQPPGRETGAGGAALSWDTAETCNTYNMLKLTGELFQHEPAEEYAAYYERALYNHILASLDPDSGMATYFVALQSGRFKTYGQPEGSCWCCTGSGLENPSVYGQHIYFHSDETLWINLFIPSVLDWSERGMTVRMETAFPESDTVRIIVGAGEPTRAKLRLRIPRWISAPAAILVNGEDPGVTAAPGGYAELDRMWTGGDEVLLTVPMGLHLDTSMDDPKQVSLFYGPVLLAGDLGTEGMPASDKAADQWDHRDIPTVPAPSLVTADAADLASWVRPGVEPLEFVADAGFAGAARRGTVNLRPFYDTHHTRYAVYWKLVAPDGVSSWNGGGSSGDWSDGGNWDESPAAGNALRFAAGSGGTPVNDLSSGTAFHGFGFPAAAGPFAAGGNAVGLRGDIRNFSPHTQRLDLPLHLLDGMPWRFEAICGGLVIGAPVTGDGSIQKTGEFPLVLLGDCSFVGTVAVDEGALEVGNGGAAGGLGATRVDVSRDARLVFDRGDDFTVDASIGGQGKLVKQGAGTMTLVSPSSLAAGVEISQGVLRLGSREVPSLLHRWSFNGDLTDSAGGADAAIIDAGSNNATLSATEVTLAGGNKGASDYVSLGAGLLPKDGTPVTLELWATPHGLRSWSRIFDVGASTTENLFMAWSQVTQANDRVEWRDSAGTQTANDTVAPYGFGTEQHILMCVEPLAGAGGTTRVTWYVSPSAAADLGAARGSFDTPNTLAELTDSVFWLGRSQYNDPTANAGYNEVRIWHRGFNEEEREMLHDLGPDSVGTFAFETVHGGLADGAPLAIAPGAGFELNGRTQSLASLAGGTDAVVDLGGGRLEIRAGEDAEVAFAGVLSGPGEVVNRGTLRLSGSAAWPAGVSLVNHGFLDLLTWKGGLPEGFVNEGTVLGHGKLRIDSIARDGSGCVVRIHGHRGHGYRLERTDDPGSGIWEDVGDVVEGAGVPIDFTDAAAGRDVRRFYRVAVSP